jgi:asparagine synthase (glutamine-hydrolysing)
MCGINFIWDKKNQKSPEIVKNSIAKMNEKLRHRGQDFEGFFAFQNYYFGHLKLAIIDATSQSNQPFISEDKRYILVFNGEIYNYKVLKKQLSNQYNFVTNSDTELLLYWLIDQKNEEELNGMFAYVFLDTHTKILKYNRDRNGIKPLYKFENEDYLVISSEIQGILASNLVEKKLNESQIIPYLSNKFPTFPQTFFKNIQEVKPQEITNKNTLFLPNISLKKTNELLKNAINLQNIADFDIALMLSGGVDSTLILAYLQEISHKKVSAFTIVYPDEDQKYITQDAYFAQKASQQYGAEYHPIVVESTILDDFQIFAENIDQPIADPAFYLTQIIAKEISKSHKITFSGAGADEVFAGYNRHWAFYNYLKIQKFIGKNTLNFFKIIDNKNWIKSRLWKKLLNTLQENPSQTFLNFTQTTWAKYFEKQVSIWQENISRENHLKNALEYDIRNFLQNDVLKINDLASMKYTIETRVPFLENQITNVFKNIQANYLLKYGKKWLLKKILTQKGGKLYAYRKKQGFGMPLSNWIRKEKYKKQIQENLHQKKCVFEYVEYKNFRYLWEQHQQNKADFSTEIWSLWLLNTWLEKNF